MRIHGRHGQVSLADDSPEVVLGSLNHWTGNFARDYVEVTCFGDDEKQWVPGLPNREGTLAGFYDLDVASPIAGASLALFEAAEGDTPVTLKLVPSTLDLSHFWSGLAYLDVSIDVAVNGAVTLSGNWKGAGTWTRV